MTATAPLATLPNDESLSDASQCTQHPEERGTKPPQFSHVKSAMRAIIAAVATILVLVHEYDRFHAQSYLLQGLFPHWIEAGHVVAVHEGLEGLPEADVVFLHVDLTV